MAFDVITPVKLGAAELAITPSFTTLRTTPANTRDLVKNIDIANNGAVTAVVSVHLVESGDLADNTNIIMPGVNIAKNTLLQWTGVQVTNASDTIQAQSSTADVCIVISGGTAT